MIPLEDIRRQVAKHLPQGEMGVTAEKMPWIRCRQLLTMLDTNSKETFALLRTIYGLLEAGDVDGAMRRINHELSLARADGEEQP